MENTPESFYNFLIDNGFIISKINAKIIWMGMFITSPKAFIFEGPAGTGKTKITELMNEYIKIVKGHCEYLFFQCVYGTDENEIIYKIVPTGGGFETIPGVLPSALEYSKTSPTIVTLDEFDKTRMSADALLLDYLQNGRISMIGRDSKTIYGNQDNLIVVLTSNAFREFSEPLLRRCIVVNFSQLSPSDVKKTLSTYFDNNISEVLTEIYINTINANLEKPATIQELIQLGDVLKYGYNKHEFRQYLRAYILKTEHDAEKYFEMLSYKHGEENLTYESDEQQDEDTYYDNIIDNMPHSIHPHDFTYNPRIEDEIEDYGIVMDFNVEVLNTLGAIFSPSSDPHNIGGFEVVYCPKNNKYYIVRKDPITMEDLSYKKKMHEGYKIDKYHTKELLFKLDRISEYIKCLKEKSIKIRMETHVD